MTFLVPFDDSELARTAVVRAREYGAALKEDVVAVAVIPAGVEYAREKGWIDEEMEFDFRSVVGDLHESVLELAPEAAFEYERVAAGAGAGIIARELRKTAEAVDASVVFIGSENAGQIVTPVSSVGGQVTSELDYDVHLVRRRRPSKVEAVRARSGPESEFYTTSPEGGE